MSLQHPAESSRRQVFALILYRAFGLILIASVVLKITGSQGVSLASPNSTLPDLSLLFVGAELLLGVWFVSGAAPRAGRVVAMLTLLVFCAVNLVGVYRGAQSCGCFGDAKVPPAVVAIAEAVVLIAIARPPVKRAWSPADSNALWVVGLGAVLFAGYVGVGYAVTGRLAPDWYGPGKAEADFAERVADDAPGSVTDLELSWTNPTGEPVQLTFLKSSCSCMKSRALPVWVAPQETVKIPVAFTSPAAPGKFRISFAIMTSGSTLRGFVHGRVREAAG